jgi:hypothetical protein
MLGQGGLRDRLRSSLSLPSSSDAALSSRRLFDVCGVAGRFADLAAGRCLKVRSNLRVFWCFSGYGIGFG